MDGRLGKLPDVDLADNSWALGPVLHVGLEPKHAHFYRFLELRWSLVN